MSKVVIIAEAGVNHNGNYELAKRMIEVAKDVGADYIKFQTAIPKQVISKFAEMATYQKINVGKQESQLEMCEKIHLPLSCYASLREYCNDIGIKFLSTPFDLQSIDTLSILGMDYMKIPSGEVTNLPYLRKIARLHMPVILSTGMCRLGEIEEALDVLLSNGLSLSMISLLHCNTEYPTPMSDVNLYAMQTLKQAFGVRVGYSDHTKGIEVPIAAVAVGAEIIEKHFTLDKTLPGPDHVASLEPSEFKEMVKAIRNIEQALGDGIKKVSKSEYKNLNIARKSIVASRNIKAGEPFTEDNITVKRPGNGISPMSWDSVLGQIATRDFQEDELIVL
ncbi:N-acetylneuraminate synthase [Mediterranea sp. An20]|uniref:N-acetylneuraminate synthase n=1 Tax=Mediterranea sp. An20 TaxID=1965586 RepID=UPI000B39B5FA|nr:N-acetylneuraminate synthase [Mediterranea sp. An20]OUP09316.1 N-acetylneuraminate synthase [Mediterranea sp. An20]